MRRIIILAALLTLILSVIDNAEAIREKSGRLEKDEIWSGKIEVTGAVLVLEGVTLTIKPGTTIEIINGSIYIKGKLIAEGIKSKRIIFNYKRGEGKKGYIIQFMDVSDSSSVVKYATITNAFAGITCSGASPTISRNIIQGNHVGILIKGKKPGVPMISYNTVVGNVWGIVCSSQRANIRNNIISENQLDGIRSVGLPSPRINGNILSHNEVGISCKDSSPYIAHNIIYDNFVGISAKASSSVITSNIISACNYGISESDGAKTIIKYNDILGRFLYANWQAGINLIDIKDVNNLRRENLKNISEEPKFMAPENGNFDLAPGSPCRGRGEHRRNMGPTGMQMAVEMQRKIPTTWGKIKQIK